MAKKKVDVYKAPFSEPYTVTPVEAEKKVDPLVEIAKLAAVQDGAPLMREALIKIAQICKENLRQ